MSPTKRGGLFSRRRPRYGPPETYQRPAQRTPQARRELLFDPEPPKSAVDPLVVAAIDFGTHGTGFAWAIADDLDKDPDTTKINFYGEWAGTLTAYPKNLSALLLDGNEVKHWGYSARWHWAKLRAEGKASRLGYVYAFKMALKPSLYEDSLPRGNGRLSVGSPEDARPLIVLYLERIRQTALREITQAGYREDQIRWCVTVPAIWDPPDHKLMREAALDAGFPEQRVVLVREPEAAALQCQVHLARLAAAASDGRALGDLRAEGSRFVVVDCGGGTVDITAYRVTKSPEGKSQLVELCKASGGKFGSEYINRAFVDRVLTKFFGSPGIIDKLQQEFPQDMLEIVDEWERGKLNVEVELDRESGKLRVTDSILLNIPYSVVDFLRRQKIFADNELPSRIQVETAEIEELFESTIGDVLGEIAGRLREVRENAGPAVGPELLLLVGGFAASAYLQESIKLRFGDEVEIIVPDKPAAAVMFGAVRLCHRPDAIFSRCARYTYGIRYLLPFESGVDDGREQVLDDGGKPYIHRFWSIVQVGASVEVGRVDEQVVFPLRRDQKEVAITMLSSAQREPRYPDEPGVKMLGNLRVDLAESVGQEIRDREVQLEMHFGETEIRVEAANPRTGSRYNTKVSFDYY